MEGEEVICPDSVLKALSSHGWIIPSEQQVSKNIPYLFTYKTHHFLQETMLV